MIVRIAKILLIAVLLFSSSLVLGQDYFKKSLDSARTAIEMGNHQEALEGSFYLQEQYPDKLEPFLIRAVAYIMLDKQEEAEEAIDEILTRTEDENLRMLEHANYDEALQILAKELQILEYEPPEERKVKWVYRLISYAGAFIMLIIGIVVVVFLFGLLPKKVKSCPVAWFKNAQQIRVLASDEEKIVVRPDSPDFNTIVSSFSEEKREPDYETYSIPLELKIKNKSYAVLISSMGWNFKGEQRNSRRLTGGIGLASLVNEIIERNKKAG